MLDDHSLATGVAALLEARGEKELGAIVRRSFVLVVGPAERWSIGAQDVSAHHVALVVSAADHVLVAPPSPRFDVVYDAFAKAVQSPETKMKNLSVVLELPPSRTTFAQGYRDAPIRTFDTPAADAVLGGAAALCQALGDEAAARALSRATLEDAYVATGERSVRRFVLRLDAADFALTERHVEFGDRLMRAVRSAATTPTEATSAVFLAVRLVDAHAPLNREAPLVRALEKKNAVVVPISRDESGTRFAVVYQEKLAIVEVLYDSKRAGKKIKSGTTKIGAVQLTDRALESLEAAEMASADILREIYEK